MRQCSGNSQATRHREAAPGAQLARAGAVFSAGGRAFWRDRRRPRRNGLNPIGRPGVQPAGGQPMRPVGSGSAPRLLVDTPRPWGRLEISKRRVFSRGSAFFSISPTSRASRGSGASDSGRSPNGALRGGFLAWPPRAFLPRGCRLRLQPACELSSLTRMGAAAFRFGRYASAWQEVAGCGTVLAYSFTKTKCPPYGAG